MELENRDQNQYLTTYSEEDEIFSEDALRQLCKFMTKLFPRDEIEVDEHTLLHLQSLHIRLLRTASSTKLTFVHGAASLNALCAFIEQCTASSVPELRNLSLSSATWIEAFNIFLDRSDRNKAKPMRRLLLALTDSVKKHARDEARLALIGHAMSRATRAIYGQYDVASVKSAILALGNLINADITTAQEIVNHMTWISENPSAIFEGGMASVATNKSSASWFQGNETVERFTLSILKWIQYPDCAPAAGRFLTIFYKSLSLDCNDRTAANKTFPIWINPVKRAINGHSELLEAYEHHVLPGLLNISPANTRAFLDTLPFKSIEGGNVGAVAIVDIQLCILVANLAATLKPEGEDTPDFGAASRDRQDRREEQASLSLDPEALAIDLLEHNSASVRLAALSLLLSSPVTSKPLSQRALDKVRVHIPYFHVEVNPKARNEFIVLMKKLCKRVKCAASSLLRAEQTSMGSSSANSDEVEHASVTDANDMWKSSQRLLRSHLAFRRRYLLFLLHELRPTASYQSHIIALKTLYPLVQEELASQAIHPKGIDVYLRALDETVPQHTYYASLFDLLLDPFDDVRQWAAKVLELFFLSDAPISPPLAAGAPEEESYKLECNKDGEAGSRMIYRALQIAEKRAEETGRADHADGVGRLYDMLYSTNRAILKPTAWHNSGVSTVNHLISVTEEEVRIANHDLLQAISNPSLHGHLVALRYIVFCSNYFVTLNSSVKHGLELWRDYTRRIRVICCDVWEAVRNTLCYDAPEGHGVDEEADDDDVGTKDTLSFCWRALKESSSLLYAMITNKGYGPPSANGKVLWDEDYRMIGNLCFRQLEKLRHRGAFSTVSQTFSACCMGSLGIERPEHSCLVQTWYYDALACMERNASSLTRRSAGIPAMVTGILAAYAGHKFFDTAMLDLQTIADDPIPKPESGDLRLPQVHALNCLKDVFTDARLGPSTEKHVADSIEIAASCLDSPIWAIRNCGLMLFKALIRRLNGGTDTSSTKVTSSYRRSSALTYGRYTNLPDIVVELLCNCLPSIPTSIDIAQIGGHSAIYAHKVFPAMEILERSGLPSKHGKAILAALRQFMESFDWLVREKAAKTLSYVLDERDLVAEADKLLSPNWQSQNALHGRLLCLRYLFSRSDISATTIESMIPLINARCERMTVQNPCPVTTAAYINLVADIFIILLQQKSRVSQSIFDQIRLLIKTPFVRQTLERADPALALQQDAMKRILSLNMYLETLAKPLSLCSHHDSDAIKFLDSYRKYMSDENYLAILRIVPPDLLRCQTYITQLMGKSYTKAPNSVHQAGFALAVCGHELGISYAGLQEGKSDLRISAWIRLLFVSGAENSELLDRAAAACSLQGFFHGFNDVDKGLRSMPALLEIYVVLYDILMDDDEDIRDQGAKTVSSILSIHTRTSLSLSAPAAKKRLLRFLKEEYRDSKSLFVAAVRKLTGLPSMYFAPSHAYGRNEEDEPQEIAFHLPFVAELSAEAQKTQNTVFAEEKQNLYLDSAFEASEWANVMVQIDPEAWQPGVVSTLQSWTVEGLTYFADFYTKGDESETLGPAFVSKIYTLITRVIISAKALLSRTHSISSNETTNKNESRTLLKKLQGLGEKRALHGLLQDRIKAILAGVTHPTESLSGEMPLPGSLHTADHAGSDSNVNECG